MLIHVYILDAYYSCNIYESCVWHKIIDNIAYISKHACIWFVSLKDKSNICHNSDPRMSFCFVLNFERQANAMALAYNLEICISNSL